MPYVWYSCSEVCLLSSQLFRCLPCVQLIVQRCVLRWDSSLEVHRTSSTVIQRCVLYSVNCPDVYFTSVVQRRVLQPVNRPELCLMSCQLFRGVSCVQSIVQRHVVCQVNWLEVCLMSSQLFRGVLYVQSVQCFVFHCVSYSQVHLTSSQLFRGLSYIPLVVERCVLWQSIVQRCVLWQSIVQRCVLWQSIIQRCVLWQSVVQSVFCDSWLFRGVFYVQPVVQSVLWQSFVQSVFCDSHLFRGVSYVHTVITVTAPRPHFMAPQSTTTTLSLPTNSTRWLLWLPPQLPVLASMDPSPHRWRPHPPTRVRGTCSTQRTRCQHTCTRCCTPPPSLPSPRARYTRTTQGAPAISTRPRRPLLVFMPPTRLVPSRRGRTSTSLEMKWEVGEIQSCSPPPTTTTRPWNRRQREAEEPLLCCGGCATWSSWSGAAVFSTAVKVNLTASGLCDLDRIGFLYIVVLPFFFSFLFFFF